MQFGRLATAGANVPILRPEWPIRNCSDLRGSADYSACCGGQPSTVFPLQTVSVPSNVNSYANSGVLDPSTTQCYRWVMIPQFDADGLLPPGIHWATWDEVTATLSNTPWRRQPLAGLEMAIESLRRAGCRTVYIDGSFVMGKEIPNDFDACWAAAGVAPELLDPVLLRFDAGRAAQKARYLWGAVSSVHRSDCGRNLFSRILPDGQGDRKDQGHRCSGSGRSLMIKNERQYRITRTQAERFGRTLRGLRERSGGADGIHPIIAQAQVDAVSSQLADLEVELREYEAVREGEFQVEALRGVADLPMLLIKARIAGGLTQRELADRMGLKEQQIQRYEATDYAAAKWSRIREVADVLSMELGGSIQSVETQR